MLASLKINNVALIESLEIDFANGLNAITGETGSGKSILLNALGFVVGDRLDKTMLRTGTEFMKVDAVFIDIRDSVVKQIEELVGIHIDNNELKINREYYLNGKSTCRVNGELVTTGVLKKVSQLLIDIHGQHEHQALLDNAFQLQILDKFCKQDISDRLESLNGLIDQMNDINSKLKLIGGDQTNKQNLIDLYSYQLDEIEKSGIVENELEELEQRFKEMKESEKLSSILNNCLTKLDKNPYGESAIDQIITSSKELASITNIAEKYNDVYTRLNSLSIELQDVVEEISSLSNNLVFDQAEFDRIDERIDFIKSMFRKYGGDYSSFVKYKNDIDDKLNNLVNSEEQFVKLNIEKDKLLSKINALQQEISNIRKQNAVVFGKEIEEQLRLLGMPQAKFVINFEKTTEPYTRTGFDVVDFMFSANLGFEPKPLNKVASGGELSRFMLAYKIVVNSIDEIDTLIFDEIDTGISGNIANVVADCMGKLSRTKQLLVVSHLPQICAMADINFLVEKITKNTTITTLKELDQEGVFKEIARLMGLIGMDGIDYAKKLKLSANNFKQGLIQ